MEASHIQIGLSACHLTAPLRKMHSINLQILNPLGKAGQGVVALRTWRRIWVAGTLYLPRLDGLPP